MFRVHYCVDNCKNLEILSSLVRSVFKKKEESTDVSVSKGARWEVVLNCSVTSKTYLIL